MLARKSSLALHRLQGLAGVSKGLGNGVMNPTLFTKVTNALHPVELLCLSASGVHASHHHQPAPGLFHQAGRFQVEGVGNRRQVAVPLDAHVCIQKALA